MANATNKKFFGFYTVTTNGNVSVQVVDGAKGEGYATEKTARTKLAAYLAKPRKSVVRDGSDVVIAFVNSADMLKYLDQANRLVRGQP